MTTTQHPKIRPPWPDELARTWKFIGETRQMKGQVHPRIAVIGEPERIVGAAALQIGADAIGRLYLTLRSRFCEYNLVAAFCEEAQVIARQEGLREVVVVLPEAAPWRPLLETAGFTCQRTDEWWRVGRDAQVDARLETAARLITMPRVSKDLSMDILPQEDYPAVQAIAMEHGLANLERLGAERMLTGASGEYSAELSVVVRCRDEVAGVMLVRRLGEQAFVHVRAVAKKHRAHSKAINAHFMARFGQAPYRDVNGFLFSAQPTVERETIAMAKRFGGSKIAGFSSLRKTV